MQSWSWNVFCVLDCASTVICYKRKSLGGAGDPETNFSKVAYNNCNSYWLNLVICTMASVSTHILHGITLYILHAYRHALFMEILREIHPN